MEKNKDRAENGMKEIVSSVKGGRGYVGKVLSVVISVLIIGLIITSGPIQALVLNLSEPSVSEARDGEDISFDFSLNVPSGETFNGNVNVFINNGKRCEFDLGGNIVSGSGCEGISVVKLDSFHTSGYGYGYGDSNSYIYNVTIRSCYFTSGNYNIYFKVDNFPSATRSFSVVEGGSCLNESSCSSDNLGSCVEANCSSSGGFWYNGVCNVDSSTAEDDDIGNADNYDLGGNADNYINSVSSSCKTAWICGEWSGCVLGKETRICEKEKAYCFALLEDKPVGERDCSVGISGNQQIDSTGRVVNAINLSQEEEKETGQDVFSSITGAVVGASEVTGETGLIVIIVFLIAIVGLAIVFVVVRKGQVRRRVRRRRVELGMI